MPIPTSAASPPLYHDKIYTLGVAHVSHGDDLAWVEVPGTLANPSYLEFSWTDADGNEQSAGFGVNDKGHPPGKTRMAIGGNDITPIFTGHDSDGSVSHATLSSASTFLKTRNTTCPGPLLPALVVSEFPMQDQTERT